MSDERAFESAKALEERHIAAKIAKGGRQRTHAIVVLGLNRDKPFEVVAHSREECMKSLSSQGVDVDNDKWGAGYVFGDDVSLYGTDDRAKQIVERHLRRR